MDASIIMAALEARDRAFAPYSKFAVGAAILTPDGAVIRGVNVENASFGLTMCAERVAVGAAVSQGYRSFSAIAIASEGGVTPCGACRQVLAQFGLQLEIILVNASLGEPERVSQIRSFRLSSLLPESFSFDDKGHLA